MKGICGFCGHRDAPSSIRSALESAIERYIVSGQVDTFYVGNQGAYDRIVTGILQKLKKKYADIQYYVVLAYLPGKKRAYADEIPTILPEGIELVPSQFAIARRNRWMVDQVKYMIAYITRDMGGADPGLRPKKGRHCGQPGPRRPAAGLPPRKRGIKSF